MLQIHSIWKNPKHSSTSATATENEDDGDDF